MGQTLSEPVVDKVSVSRVSAFAPLALFFWLLLVAESPVNSDGAVQAPQYLDSKARLFAFTATLPSRLDAHRLLEVIPKARSLSLQQRRYAIRFFFPLLRARTRADESRKTPALNVPWGEIPSSTCPASPTCRRNNPPSGASNSRDIDEHEPTTCHTQRRDFGVFIYKTVLTLNPLYRHPPRVKMTDFSTVSPPCKDGASAWRMPIRPFST